MRDLGEAKIARMFPELSYSNIVGDDSQLVTVSFVTVSFPDLNGI